MNLPNSLTLLRMILVLPFLSIMIYLNQINQDIIFKQNLNQKTILFIVSGLIFIVAMVTDFVDGYLARKNNQITNFGKLFDPLADKLMTSSALIMLSILKIVPIYLTIIFILRDIIVDGCRNLAAKQNVEVSASKIGKWKTLIQSIAIVIIFLFFGFLKSPKLDLVAPSWEVFIFNILLFIAAILSIISGVKYFVNIKTFLFK